MKANPKVANSTFPWAGIINLAVAVLYGASPIDLIPDVIFVLGWLDDAIAVPLFIFLSILGFMRHRKMQAKASPANAYVDTQAREPVIPKSYK